MDAKLRKMNVAYVKQTKIMPSRLNEVREETESNFLNICEFSIFFQVPDKQIPGITFNDERGNIIDAKASTWKMAKPEDFEIIFNREFEKTELKDNEKDKQFFCKWLNKFVHQLEKDYKKALIIKERSPELLCTNDLFKKWLTKKIDPGIERDDESTPNKSNASDNKLIKPFAEYLISDNKDNLINDLNKLIRGKGGRDIAAVIRALKKLNWIEVSERGRKSLYRAMRKKFGITGTDQAIDKYMMSEKITPDALTEQISKIADKLSK